MKKGNFLTKNWLLLLVIVYILSPLDLIPDTIPVVGTLDDIALLIVELIRRYKVSKATKTDIQKFDENKDSLPQA